MVFKYITVAAFHIYAERDEDASKKGGWRPCEITLFIMEKSWNCFFFNFCGNPGVEFLPLSGFLLLPAFL